MHGPREWAAPAGYVVSTDPVRLDVETERAVGERRFVGGGRAAPEGPQRGYVLLPLVGTSPPPGEASLLLALHTGQGLLALPGGGRGNTRMTYEVSLS